jgi:hypothetical protein
MASYSAIICHPDTQQDLGPVNVDDALDGAHAIELAKARAPGRIGEEGLTRAFVQVSCDGHSLGRFEVLA